MRIIQFMLWADLQFFSTVKHCKLLMYADDAVLISVHKSFDDAVAHLQEDVNFIRKWCHDSSLVINENKTKIMHITGRVSYK